VECLGVGGRVEDDVRRTKKPGRVLQVGDEATAPEDLPARGGFIQAADDPEVARKSQNVIVRIVNSGQFNSWFEIPNSIPHAREKGTCQETERES
jgi:hypothetical protein